MHLMTYILVSSSALHLLHKSSRFSLSFSPSQIIKHLRTAEFKPFIVFVKPPSIETLRETRQNGKVVAGKDDNKSAKPFTVRECLFSVFSNNLMGPDGPDGFALISTVAEKSECPCARLCDVRSGLTRL